MHAISRRCSSMFVTAILLAACGRSDLLPKHSKGGTDASEPSGGGLLEHPWPVHAISPPTSGTEGVLKWVVPLEGTQVSAPAIGADGTVYVTADDTLYAIQ
jgi:hypothetical protein